MAGLQRSAVSFRRQGSSGFVWDDRFLSGELNKVNNNKEDQVQQQQQQGQEEGRQQQQQQHKGEINIKELHAGGTATNTGGGTVVQRSRSNGGARGYRTGKVSPAIEPPSPKLSSCGCCGAFGKKTGEKGQRGSKPGKHRQGRVR